MPRSHGTDAIVYGEIREKRRTALSPASLPAYNILGWKTNEFATSIPSESALAPLPRLSHLLGRHAGPFHSRPGKRTAGRHAFDQEIDGGQEIVRREPDLSGRQFRP